MVAYGANRDLHPARFAPALDEACQQGGTLDALALCDSPLVDAADVLPDRQGRSLAKALTAAERDTGSQIVVVTVPSLGGREPEQAALTLAERWKLGGESADGAILLFALNDRKVRLQYGRGFKPRITDVEAAAVIQGEFTPRAKAGDVSGAIVATAERVVEQRRANR